MYGSVQLFRSHIRSDLLLRQRPLQHLDLCLHQTQRTLLLALGILVVPHRRVALEINQCPDPDQLALF